MIKIKKNNGISLIKKKNHPIYILISILIGFFIGYIITKFSDNRLLLVLNIQQYYAGLFKPETRYKYGLNFIKGLIPFLIYYILFKK